MAGWVKITQLNAGVDNFAVSARATGVEETSFYYRNASAAWIGTNEGGNIGGTISPAPGVGVWVYIAFTTSATQKIYYWWDAAGVLQDTLGPVGVAASTAFNGINVGSRGVFNEWQLDCKVAYWKVWDATLTQTEIESEIFSPTFVRTANANTGFADSATDISGNGRNWTLTNTSFDADSPLVAQGLLPRSMLLGVG